MRLRKMRLIDPIAALKANRTANCHGAGVCPRHRAERIKLMKLARLTQAASRERYFPRTPSGTREAIQGSQAQLEMPRERLKAKSSMIIRARRFEASKKLRRGI